MSMDLRSVPLAAQFCKFWKQYTATGPGDIRVRSERQVRANRLNKLIWHLAYIVASSVRLT